MPIPANRFNNFTLRGSRLESAGRLLTLEMSDGDAPGAVAVAEENGAWALIAEDCTEFSEADADTTCD